MNPNYKFYVNREEDRTEFLLDKNRMKGEYLGACLDYIRLGSINTVMYKFSVKGLIGFIQDWMILNKDNLIFSDVPLPKDFKLPHIDYTSCPRKSEHNGIMQDISGRLRCANTEIKKFKPNFIDSWNNFDEFSMTERINYFEQVPHNDVPDAAWDEETGELLSSYDKQYNDYLEQEKIFDDEEPTLEINDLCYAIISDKGTILSLENVLERLNIFPKTQRIYCPGYNGCTKEEYSKMSKEDKEWHSNICPGHDKPTNQSVFPFDGWSLAGYVEKWYKQLPDGKAPVFNNVKDKDCYNA